MATLSTDDFPFTIASAMSVLQLSEAELSNWLLILGLTPSTDPASGQLVLTHHDIQRIKKAMLLPPPTATTSAPHQQQQIQQSTPPQPVELTQQQPEHVEYRPAQESVPSYQVPVQPLPQMSTQSSARPGTPNAPPKMQMQPVGQTMPKAPTTNTAMRDIVTQGQLSKVIEKASLLKNEILKDLSRMLDDKLNGLDEVVVELIRAKSENDMLKRQLLEAENRIQQLESELTEFKPLQFGFYRRRS